MSRTRPELAVISRDLAENAIASTKMFHRQSPPFFARLLRFGIWEAANLNTSDEMALLLMLTLRKTYAGDSTTASPQTAACEGVVGDRLLKQTAGCACWNPRRGSACWHATESLSFDTARLAKPGLEEAGTREGHLQTHLPRRPNTCTAVSGRDDGHRSYCESR